MDIVSKSRIREKVRDLVFILRLRRIVILFFRLTVSWIAIQVFFPGFADYSSNCDRWRRWYLWKSNRPSWQLWLFANGHCWIFERRWKSGWRDYLYVWWLQSDRKCFFSLFIYASLKCSICLSTSHSYITRLLELLFRMMILRVWVSSFSLVFSVLYRAIINFDSVFFFF